MSGILSHFIANISSLYANVEHCLKIETTEIQR